MSEHAHQVALFQWAHAQEPAHPELSMLFAIPNGGQRNKITAAKLKAEGVKSGVPDICLPVARHGYHALYIELKRPKTHGTQAGAVTANQCAWIAGLREQGNMAVVCYGWEDARRAIMDYIGGDSERT